MARLVSIAAVTVAFIGLGSQASAETPAATLAQLRQLLEEVRAEPAGQAIDLSPALDVAPLIGVPQAEVRSALGDPSGCRSPSDPPCSPPSDWTYDFFRLPPHSFGGGSTLLITFDASGHCSGARWVQTQ